MPDDIGLLRTAEAEGKKITDGGLWAWRARPDLWCRACGARRLWEADCDDYYAGTHSVCLACEYEDARTPEPRSDEVAAWKWERK